MKNFNYKIISAVFLALISASLVAALIHSCGSGFYLDPTTIATVTPTPGPGIEYTPYTVSWSEGFDFSQGTFDGATITESGDGIQLDVGDPQDFRPTHICVGVANSEMVCFHELDNPDNKTCYDLDPDDDETVRPSRTAIDKNGYCFVGGDITSGGNGKLYKVHKDYGVIGVGTLPDTNTGDSYRPKAHSVVIDAQNFVWVGDSRYSKIFKFSPNPVGGVLSVVGDSSGYDVATGAISQPAPYGAAIDSQGYMYIVGKQGGPSGSLNPGFISKLDTSDGSLIASAAIQIYGITIDDDDYPWVGDYNGGHLRKVDKQESGASLNVLLNIDVGAEAGTSNIRGRGVGKDTDGNIWYADSSNDYLYKFQPDGTYLGKVTTDPDPDDGSCGPVGVSGDPYGFVWAVNRDCDSLVKIPKDISSVTQHVTEDGPYSYSDMVGFGLFSTVLKTQGTWSVNFDAGYESPQWESLNWRAKTNEQTDVFTEVRVAASEEELDAAIWYGPYLTSPADIDDIPSLRWIQIRVTFQTENPGGITPILEDLNIGFNLPDT